ncbi:hypothetical protein ID866_6097 [Astraeus odoratus]|nr:hypothetical protein ID866_6097 [Astraeus odoratus]
MSRAPRVNMVAQIPDAILGAFALVPSSAALDHLVRYISTWSGTETCYQLVQYTLKLIAPVLIARARLQHRVGLRKDPSSNAAASVTKFADIVGDFRMLGRFCGLFPVLQWMISMERSPPPTRALLNIERLQGWSMLAYYPLEHLYYLRVHDVIPATLPSLTSIIRRSSSRMNLNATKLAMWSCRAWAVYVLLQFAHLMEDRQLLLTRERHLRKSKDASVEAKAELRRSWDTFWNEVIANTANLPLAIHWSLKNGIFTNELWPSFFALVNAIAAFRSGWRATALPVQRSSAESDLDNVGDLLVDEKQEI